MRSTSILNLAVALGLAACGGDDGLSTNLQAVYGVSTWTQNATACDAEGATVADLQDPFFYIKTESFFGESILNVKQCDTVAECQMLARDKDTIHLGSFNFEEGSDAEGWTNRGGFAFSFQGMCEGSIHEVRMTSTGSGVRIEDRRFEAVPFPADSSDECPDDKLEAAVAGQPCSELEVVTAAKTADF
ncbi:MAG: hypothetical protein H0T89_09855 [Deltaproteobacteria bacterium]|nr:hypothetical protein [Deltaproteobacteria bacterium]MDQ3299385.1 hypothetical protein [Myxococcota bacterium]